MPLLPVIGTILFDFIAPIVRIEKVRSSISSANSSLRYRLASHDTMTTITEYELPVDHPWEFPRHQLVLDKVIGEGAFGKVKRNSHYYLTQSDISQVCTYYKH